MVLEVIGLYRNLTIGKITGDGSGATNISGLSQISDSIAILIRRLNRKQIPYTPILQIG